MLRFVCKEGYKMVTIGEFLKQRRSVVGISQADLATRLTLRGHATTKANVGHWEKGRHIPPIEDHAFRMVLSSALEIDVNEMMTILGFVVTEDKRSGKAKLAADLIDQLPEDAKDLALEIIKGISKRYIQNAS